MSSIYLGIDPGKQGFITGINPEVDKIAYYAISSIGDQVNLQELDQFLSEIAPFVKHCVIEDVHAIFGAAAKATFNFGHIVGVLEGMLTAYKIPFTKVQPKKWQKEMWEGIPLQQSPSSTGKTMKTDTKKMSLLAVKRLFPNEDLRRTERSKKDDDNKVDSLLIAEYCRRHYAI